MSQVFSNLAFVIPDPHGREIYEQYFAETGAAGLHHYGAFNKAFSEGEPLYPYRGAFEQSPEAMAALQGLLLADIDILERLNYALRGKMEELETIGEMAANDPGKLKDFLEKILER